MGINQQLVEKKLTILKDYLRQIETMEFDVEALLKTKDIQQLLSFRLQQAVETAIEISTHIIAGLELERQETARSSFQVLAEEGIISKQLADNLAMACSFRNLIVHGYQKIDFKRVFYDYKDDLKDLRQFAKQIYHFMTTYGKNKSS